MDKDQENPDSLLEQIKNLTLSYNVKVTPRKQITIRKPENVFQLLTKNPLQGKNVMIPISF